MPDGRKKSHLRLVTDLDAEVEVVRRLHPPRAMITRYIVDVGLVGIQPRIWRLMLFDSSITLDELHEALQKAMGWENRQPHRFVMSDDPRDRDALAFASETEATKSLPDSDRLQSEAGVQLDELLAEPGDTICYVYGDNWVHHVKLEAAGRRIDNDTVCLDGKQACPPEACNGPSDYADLVKALADPSHPRHRRLKSKFGDFDPNEAALLPRRSWPTRETTQFGRSQFSVPRVARAARDQGPS